MLPLMWRRLLLNTHPLLPGIDRCTQVDHHRVPITIEHLDRHHDFVKRHNSVARGLAKELIAMGLEVRLELPNHLAAVDPEDQRRPGDLTVQIDHRTELLIDVSVVDPRTGSGPRSAWSDSISRRKQEKEEFYRDSILQLQAMGLRKDFLPLIFNNRGAVDVAGWKRLLRCVLPVVQATTELPESQIRANLRRACILPMMRSIGSTISARVQWSNDLWRE